MSYSAIVSKIKVSPHPKADRLQLGSVAGGHTIVCGLDTRDGDMGVYFPCDGALSEDFCLTHNLYNESARRRLDLDVDSGKKYGFFDHNGRVRAQSFRGVKSDGFWMPISCLESYGDPSSFKEGDTFTEVGGVEICRKYINPATLRVMRGNRQGARVRQDTPTFPKHPDTTQWRFVKGTIPDDAVIYITEKVHGTSGRFGLVWDEVPRKWWEFWKPTHNWVYLNGSRNVILEKTSGTGFYGTNDFRYKAVEGLVGKLAKGEIIYFELVGWLSEDRPIMPPHERNGKEMYYSYGCPRGVCRMYVYDIVMMNQDGISTKLSWPQMVARCEQLGLTPVPLIAGPISLKQTYPDWWDDGVYYEDRRPEVSFNLDKEVEYRTESKFESLSTLDSSHIREGVCVRIESKEGIRHVKNKSYEFKVLEGIVKDKDDVVDIEEAS